MMRLHSVLFIVFVCGLQDVRGWTAYELNQMSNSGEKWDIYCCDDNGRAVQPWYCDPWMGGRKKRSATSNQTIVSPTGSGIKKFKKDIIPTDFKTRTWMSGKNRKNRKTPTKPESKNEITWMSGIKKNWNKKGKKTITWDGVPKERPAFNQTITDAALNQTVARNQRNGFSCGTSMTVDTRPCKYRVKNKQQMRRMQCPCCLLPSKKRQICGSRSCPC